MGTRKKPDGSNYLKYFLIFLIFLIFQNTTSLVNAQTIVLDNSENAFSGYIFWPEFLQDCGKDSYMDTGGELQDIQADIIFNFDTGKISGTISAKQVDEKFPDVYKEDSSVQGTINGIMEKKNEYGSAGYWQWVFSGEVDFTIHYHMEHKCSDDTGGYWETEDQTLTKKGVLTGGTWGELWSLDIRWEDQETRDGRTRYVQLSPDNSLSQLVFPIPIDIEVTITMPPEVDLNSDSTPFKLNVEGRDVNVIDHFEWYFAYWEPDLERYWGLQSEQHFETRGQAPLEVTESMRDEWRRVANEYGFEAEGGAEIDLQINLRTFDVDGNDLVENVAFNYTYFTSSDVSSGTESTGGETSTSETGSSSNPLVIPDVSTGLPNLSGTLIQGAVSAGAGFGLVEMFRRVFGKTPRGSVSSTDLKLLREKMKMLPPEPEYQKSGSTESEDVLRLPTEDKYQKRDRRRSSVGYQRMKKNMMDDAHFRKWAESRNWTPEQEKEAIKAAKPKWVNAYSEEFNSKREGFWLNSNKFWDHYKTLSDAEKREVDTWKQWSSSWMRRHGAGNVGKISDPHSFGISPGGSRG